MDTWNLIPMHSDFIFERHNWSHLFKYFPGLYKFGIFRNNQSGLPTSPSNIPIKFNNDYTRYKAGINCSKHYSLKL